MREICSIGHVAAQRSGKPVNRAKHGSDIGTRPFPYRVEAGRIANRRDLVPQILQQVLHVGMLVGDVHHSRRKIFANNEIVGQRREQLVVPRPSAEELDSDPPNLHGIRHR
jgi:hypothetical protein